MVNENSETKHQGFQYTVDHMQHLHIFRKDWIKMADSTLKAVDGFGCFVAKCITNKHKI